MKKIVPIIIVVIVLLLTSVWYYSTNTTTKNEAPTEDVSVQMEQSILLYPLSGEVSFKATPDAEFQKVTESPTIIPNQAIVRTDIGKASVLLPDNSSISLENNTEITVNYAEKNTSIYQSFGTTYHRVEKLITGSSYQVQTAGTLAAVRGTKFAVRYDLKTKKTKIAVTESKVQVSTIPKEVGGVKPQEESVLVEAGKTISVAMSGGAGAGASSATSPSQQKSMQVVDTVSDADMRTFVEEQKKTDIELEKVKKEHQDKEDFRKEMKRKLFDDKEEKKDAIKQDEKPIVEEKKVEIPKEEVQPKEVVKPVIEEREIVVTKMGEEEFFSAFEPLFIKYFYLDETDSACSVRVTPEERVRIVTAFAMKSGYSFTKTSLPSFAQAIDAYCAKKDTNTKTGLRGRFDDEYPF